MPNRSILHIVSVLKEAKLRFFPPIGKFCKRDHDATTKASHIFGQPLQLYYSKKPQEFYEPSALFSSLFSNTFHAAFFSVVFLTTFVWLNLKEKIICSSNQFLALTRLSAYIMSTGYVYLHVSTNTENMTHESVLNGL